MKLFQGILLVVLAQIISYVQLQGPTRWDILRKYQYVLILMGIPIGYILINSTRLINGHFNGSTWPGRLMGQSIGIIVFSIMSFAVFNEGLTMKTSVCILLSIVIILIQIYWK
jgi:hypothetical protein